MTRQKAYHLLRDLVILEISIVADLDMQQLDLSPKDVVNRVIKKVADIFDGFEEDLT